MPQARKTTNRKPSNYITWTCRACGAESSTKDHCPINNIMNEAPFCSVGNQKTIRCAHPSSAAQCKGVRPFLLLKCHEVQFQWLASVESTRRGIGSSLPTASGDASPAPTRLKPCPRSNCGPKRPAVPNRSQAPNPSMLCCCVNRRFPRAGPGCGC